LKLIAENWLDYLTILIFYNLDRLIR